MKIFKKLKQSWVWATHYKAIFVTPDRTFTIEHRIGRQPKMISQKLNKSGLRGQSISMMILDEYVGGDDAETKNN